MGVGAPNPHIVQGSAVLSGMVIEHRGSMIGSEGSEQSSGRTTFNGGGGILQITLGNFVMSSVEETGDCG